MFMLVSAAANDKNIFKHITRRSKRPFCSLELFHWNILSPNIRRRHNFFSVIRFWLVSSIVVELVFPQIFLRWFWNLVAQNYLVALVQKIWSEKVSFDIYIGRNRSVSQWSRNRLTSINQKPHTSSDPLDLHLGNWLTEWTTNIWRGLWGYIQSVS